MSEKGKDCMFFYGTPVFPYGVCMFSCFNIGTIYGTVPSRYRTALSHYRTSHPRNMSGYGIVLSRHRDTGTCEFLHTDPAAAMRILRGHIAQVIPPVQVFDAPVVCRLGTDSCQLHHLAPADIKGRGKMGLVPALEQGHIQADMSRVQTVVPVEFVKYRI